MPIDDRSLYSLFRYCQEIHSIFVISMITLGLPHGSKQLDGGEPVQMITQFRQHDRDDSSI